MGLLTVDSWRGWCDAVFWCDGGPHGNAGFRAGDVVFCKIDEVPQFFERLRLSRKKVVLVSGQGDFPCDLIRQKFLPENVVHWFATNVTVQHPRVTAVPLGLGSPASSATLQAEEILGAKAADVPRERWLYVNFRPDSNRRTRQPIFDCFRDHPGVGDWITFESPSDREGNTGFLGNLVRHRFVVCPPGNGVDTHRMWECLLAGAVPIVLRSTAMEPFSDLPILFVDDYREVTRELLEANFSRFATGRPVHPIMTEEFWERRIRDEIGKLHGRGRMSIGEWGHHSLLYGLGMIARRLGK